MVSSHGVQPITDDPRMSWSDPDGMNRGSGSKCVKSERLVGKDDAS